MKATTTILFIVLLALFAIAFTKEEESTGPSDVVVLTEKNYDEVLNGSEFVLVEFYAPWCPHCKHLTPEYEKVATALKGKYTIAKIDCDDQRDVCVKEKIPGFPVVRLFKGGKKFKDFEEDRKADAIIRWIERKTGPSATSLKDQAAIDAFVKQAADSESTAAVVVGFFANKDSEAYKTFLNASDNVEDFVFGENIDSANKDEVKLFRSHIGESDLTFDNSGDLQAWIKANGYALVDEVNAKSFQRFAQGGLPIAVAFLNYSIPEEKKATVASLRQVAEQLRGKYNFGYSDGVMYGEQLTIMGGDKTKLPGLAVMVLDTRKNYPFTGKIENTQEVVDWLNGILSGKVSPFLRSEPVPETNDEPVKVIVGKTYDEIVLDDSKDVLVEFYAPWCGHCKKLAPRYDELAESLKSVSTLVIAKVDSTANDTPYPVEGFPTIVLFPAGKKTEPVPYEGNRSVKDFKNFLKKNTTASKKALAQLLKGESKDSKSETKKTEKKHDEL